MLMSRASNRMKSHIVLVRYFAEKVQIKMTEETNEFIKGIKIKYEKKTRTKRLRKKKPQSLYATSDKNTAKQYDKEAYDNKLKELRNLIIHSKNNFNHDIHVSLLIRVNNVIVGDIWDKPRLCGQNFREAIQTPVMD